MGQVAGGINRRCPMVLPYHVDLLPCLRLGAQPDLLLKGANRSEVCQASNIGSDDVVREISEGVHGHPQSRSRECRPMRRLHRRPLRTGNEIPAQTTWRPWSPAAVQGTLG